MLRPLNSIEKFQWDERDVLYGKGAHGNHHQGNKKWKKMISDRVSMYYHATDKEEKKRISSAIVLEWRQQNGRFLAEDKDTKKWSDVGDDKATYKTAQRFRDEINRRRSENLPPFDKSEHLDNFNIDLPDISKSSAGTASARSESRKSWPGMLPQTQHNGLDLDTMESLVREWEQGEDGNLDALPALRPPPLEKRATSNQHDHESKRPSLNRDNSATANRLKEQRSIQMSNSWPGPYSSIQNPNGLQAESNQNRNRNYVNRNFVGQAPKLSYRSSGIESLDLAPLSIPDLLRQTTNDWIEDFIEAEADANNVIAV